MASRITRNQFNSYKSSKGGNTNKSASSSSNMANATSAKKFEPQGSNSPIQQRSQAQFQPYSDINNRPKYDSYNRGGNGAGAGPYSYGGNDRGYYKSNNNNRYDSYGNRLDGYGNNNRNHYNNKYGYGSNYDDYNQNKRNDYNEPTVEKDEEEEMPDIGFCPIEINNERCNINRNPKEIGRLIKFENAVPKYSKEYGVYLELVTESGKPKIYPLDNYVISGLQMPGLHDKYKGDEYYQKREENFMLKKVPFVDQMIKNTFRMGFVAPHEIQMIAIPELIGGKDAIVQYKSGKGKTFVFLFGLLWGFDPEDNVLQYIFVTYTHELAKQIYRIIRCILPNARGALCIGRSNRNKNQTNDFSSNNCFGRPISTSSLSGVQVDNDDDLDLPKTPFEEKEQAKKAQYIVATCGKLHYYVTKDIIDITYLKGFCVDEFDAIISSDDNRSRGRFDDVVPMKEQINTIICKIPGACQRAFVSATVGTHGLSFTMAYKYLRGHVQQSNSLLTNVTTSLNGDNGDTCDNTDLDKDTTSTAVVDKTLTEPLYVVLNSEDFTLQGIRQYYVKCRDYTAKKDALIELLGALKIAQAIIFANSERSAKELCAYLSEKIEKIPLGLIYGTLPVSERASIFNSFKKGITRILVSTDVLARGVDIQEVNVVFNYEMPKNTETYIHRIGRSGRFGRKGVAISLINDNSYNNISEMNRIYEINAISENNPIVELGNDVSNLL